MNRVHDMGGRYGDGAVVPEPQGVAQFAAPWHPRALALTLACGAFGKWNIDVSRHARECLAPKDYNRFSYYEKWLAALADLLVETEVLSLDDLRGTPPKRSPLADRAWSADVVPGIMARGAPADRDSNVAPLFAVGQAVRTLHLAGNRLVDGGHTRLPTYAQAATGRILRLHGAHVLPDSSAHRLGDAAEPLYAVAFPASALFVNPEHPRDEVILDLWQSYLEPA